MPYVSKAERERAEWCTIPEGIAHICAADRCPEESARAQLRNALIDGALRPLRWEDSRPLPRFSTGGLTPHEDRPPAASWFWEPADIDFAGGTVWDADGQRRRVLLLPRVVLRGLWPPSPPPKRQPVPQIEPVRGGISGLIEPDRETPRENSAAAANRDTATNLTALETARPTGSSAPYFTGLAGKPTSWHLIATECRRLWQAGERHPGGGAARQSAAEWARVLIAWLDRVHPEAPPTTEKTVSNKLPELLRELAET